MSDQVKYTNKLVGSRILVVGGTSGLGFAAAEALLENGATVILSSSSASRVESAISRLQTSYPSKSSQVLGQACDLGTDTTLESNIRSLLDFATGNNAHKLDHAILTAGDKIAIMPIAEADLAKMQKAGMVRFFAPLMFGKLAPDYMKEGPGSSITFTTGAVSERPIPNWSVVNGYATGLHGVTRGLALDLKPLRVNLVSPGPVDTELWDLMGMKGEFKTQMLKKMSQSTATGVVPGPDELAEVYLYLVKDKNITGAMISSNGGSLLLSDVHI